MMVFARQYSEAEDSILIGCNVPIVAAILARKIYYPFGGPLFPNLFNIVVTPSGLRKSTSVAFAAHIIKALLTSDRIIGGLYSEQSLFDEYHDESPDKIWIEDDANTTFRNWSLDAAGKLVASRMLKLYDCGDWGQRYRNQKAKGGKGSKRYIPQTSTSLLYGSTFDSARLHGIPCADGLRSRFSYYLSERRAQTIYHPKSFDSLEMDALISSIRPVLNLTGRVELAAQTEPLYRKIKDDLDKELEAIIGYSHQQELRRSALKIRSGYCGKQEDDGNYLLTKTQLTYRLAPHPGRPGHLCPNELYEQIIPRLIERGQAVLVSKIAKTKTYAFNGEPL
jgi:hypothetical protein